MAAISFALLIVWIYARPPEKNNLDRVTMRPDYGPPEYGGTPAKTLIDRKATPFELPVDGSRLIEVVDGADRSPVIAAEVFACSPMLTESIVGTTDECGIFDLGATHAIDQIVVRATGYQPRLVGLDDTSTGHTVVVELERGEIIRGTVLWQSGAIGPEGLTIAAWRDGLPPSVTSPDADEAILRTRTGPEGQFVLEGSDPRSTYTVTASGVGVIAVGRSMGVSAAEQALQLRVCQYLALEVRLRSPSGELIEPRSLKDKRGSLAWAHPETARTVMIDPIECALVGLAPVRSMLQSGVGTIQFTRPQAVDDPMGPFTVTASVPGYIEEQRDVLIPVATQPLQTLDWTLQYSDEQTGSLEVEVLMPSAIRAPAGTRLNLLPPCQVELMASGGSVSYPIWDLSKPRHVIKGIPHGSYTVSLKCLGSPRPVYPAGTHPIIAIGSSTPLVIFDLLDCGGIESFIQLPDGTEYRDAAAFSVSSGTNGSTTFAAFSGPPYLLFNILPGEYDIRLEAPRRGISQHVIVKQDSWSLAAHLFAAR